MAYHNNPRIVTDGLVLCLDANAKRSYSGSGSTWYDLTSNGNNGTINGATYNSGGYFAFDGTDDFVSGSVGTLNPPFTLESIGKFDNTTKSNYEYFSQIGALSNNNMVSISKIGTISADTSYHGFMYVYIHGQGSKKTNIDLRTTDYLHLTLVVTSSSPYLKVYKNGSQGSLVDTPTASVTTNGNYLIGKYVGNNWYLDGNIAATRIYNRELSSSEISQNYNAHKSRFGL